MRVTPETLTWGQWIDVIRGDDEVASTMAKMLSDAAIDRDTDRAHAILQSLCEHLNARQETT